MSFAHGARGRRKKFITHEGGPKPSHIVELMLSLDVRLVKILHTPSPHPFPFIDNIHGTCSRKKEYKKESVRSARGLGAPKHVTGSWAALFALPHLWSKYTCTAAHTSQACLSRVLRLHLLVLDMDTQPLRAQCSGGASFRTRPRALSLRYITR